jgi:hypothetical protein
MLVNEIENETVLLSGEPETIGDPATGPPQRGLFAARRFAA